MKKTAVLAGLGLFAILTRAVALPIYDPFADATAAGGTSYTPGENLSGQTNASGDRWYGANTSSTVAPVLITNGSLTFTGLPGADGDSVLMSSPNTAGGPGGRLFVGDTTAEFLATNNAATIYYSLLLRLDDITSLTEAGVYFIGLNNQTSLGDQASQPNVQATGIYFRKAGEQYQIGLGKNPANAAAPVVYHEPLFNIGETVLVVGGYEIVYNAESPSPTDDNAFMWINPEAASFGAAVPPAATLSVLGEGADINTTISSLVLLHRSTSRPDAMIVDDVRMGRTWTFVTGGPEFKMALPEQVVALQSSDLVLSVDARSGGPSALTYRWQKDGVDIEDGGRISGVNTATLTVSEVTSSDAGPYSVIVSNDMGVITSETVVGITSTSITAHPESRTNDLGTTATFSVATSGPTPAAYAWYHNGNLLSDGGSISGATTTTLTISPVGNVHPGSYHVVVETSGGSFLTSDTATLTVRVSGPEQQLYWDVNDATAGAGDLPTGTWSGTALSWSIDADGTVPTGVWLDGATAVFSAGTDAVNLYTVTISGTQIAGGLVVEEGGPTLSGGTVRFENASGHAELNVLAGASGIIGSLVAGPNDLTKTGPGSMRFNGNNASYTGRTIIREGTLALAQDNRLGAVPEVVIPDAVTLDGGTLEFVNTGAQAFNANRGFMITTNGGTLFKSAAANATINGVIAGAGPLIRTGINQFTFAGDNTYAGPFILRTETSANLTTFTASNDLADGMILEMGELRLNAHGSSGTGVITMHPGAILRTTFASAGDTLLVPNDIVTIGEGYAVLGGSGGGSQAAIHYSGVISGQGGIQRFSTGDNRVAILGDNTYSGGTKITHGNLAFGHKNALGTGTLTIGNQGFDEFPLDVGALFIQFNGISEMKGENAIPNPIVAYQQFSMAIQIQTNALEFSGPVDLAADFDIRIFANYPTLVHELSGVVSSSTGRGLAKHGVGTLILSGANTYAGGTHVATGTLRVNNTTGSGTGTGPVTMETRPGYDPAGLGGTGAIAGSMAITAGRLTPGALSQTAGILTIQNGLTMAGTDSVFEWELAALKDDVIGAAGTDFDQVALTGGSLAIDSACALSLHFIGAASDPDAGDPFWQQARQWTLVSLSGSASNPGSSSFASIANGAFAAGEFTTSVDASGSIVLHFTPVVSGFSIEGISADANSATIGWQSQNGVNYQVQYKTNINQVGWLVLTNISGTGEPLAIVDEHGGEAERYYRVAIVP